MDGKVEKKLKKILKAFPSIEGLVRDGIVYLKGELEEWDAVVEVGHRAAEIEGVKEVVNDITAGRTMRKRERQTAEGTLPESADVVIIGGGVVGCFIARELSRYDVKIVLLEKEADVGGGATKANSGQIHTGMAEKSGTLKKELCRKSWPLFEKICEELDVPFERNGLLVIVTEDTLPKIPVLSTALAKHVILPLVVKRGKEVGDNPQVIKKKELAEMEPYITKKALGAAFMPGYGIICPYKLTIALAENAVANGVSLFLETEVTDIRVTGEIKEIVTNKGIIKTKFVVNAAGVYADEIGAMAGAREYTIHPRKGSILLFDKALRQYVHHQVSEVRFPQDPHTKGGGVLMSVDGNVHWGPSAREVPDKEDTSVREDDIEVLYKKYRVLFPDFPLGVITYFSGVRAATYKEDFFIKESEYVKGVVHAAGIQSPGLTAAPAIAEMVVKILKNAGLPLKEKEFNPKRKAPPIFRELPVEEKKRLIEGNPSYGNVVCRCEHVTEGEILTAIHGVVPAVTMDGVKRRTRAGMGRCQGGFCGPRVARILARELQVPLERVTKDGKGSHLFVGRTKVVAW